VLVGLLVGAGLLLSPNPARLLQDLEYVAAERTPGSPHHEAVADLCAETFAAAGFEVEWAHYPTGVNVVGRRMGHTAPQEQVLLSAHYDHIPGCAGADDNASGVAALLEAARLLGREPLARTLVVACWDEEELGLRGARAYALEARTRGDDIVAALVVESVGFRSERPGAQRSPPGLGLLFPASQRFLDDRQGRGDFLAVVADEAAAPISAALVKDAERVGLPGVAVVLPDSLRNQPRVRDLFRSDHAAFWEHGYPALMATDTAEFRNPFYHCRWGADVPETLDVDFLMRVTAAVTATTRALAQATRPPRD
jgi:Zn-dependent M28 family amino/carboxypeptidase